MQRSIASIAVLLLLTLPACATSFRGDANISVRECNRRCTAIGARVGAYVYMGRYSTACVCEPREREGAARRSAGSPAGAVAGVWMQMQAAEEARRR